MRVRILPGPQAGGRSALRAGRRDRARPAGHRAWVRQVDFPWRFRGTWREGGGCCGARGARGDGSPGTGLRHRRAIFLRRPDSGYRRLRGQGYRWRALTSRRDDGRKNVSPARSPMGRAGLPQHRARAEGLSGRRWGRGQARKQRAQVLPAVGDLADPAGRVLGSRLPAQQTLPADKTAATAATISASSASLPTPGSSSAEAMSPSAGPTKRWPQLFKVSTLRRVAGLLHISGFIAGAQSTLFAPASIVAHSRSSPRPMAARAIASAVAGATRTRSAQRARETCSTLPECSHQVLSVWMLSPAAIESVPSGMKRKAAAVATTFTSWPASLRRRITPGALYAAMPPVTPTSIFATPVVYPAKMSDMEHTLKGKVAIVTGASSGIGEATARELASRGAAVVLAARAADKLEALEREISGSGGRALAVKTDVSDRDSVEALVGKTVEAFGSLDILVNNAGLGLSGHVAQLRAEDLRHVFEVNIVGPLNCIQAALPHMGRGGRIINVSSVIGKRAIPKVG